MSYDDYKLGVQACRDRHDTHRRRRAGMHEAGTAAFIICCTTTAAAFITAWVIAVQTTGAVAPALWIGFAALVMIPIAAYMIGASS